MKTVKRHEMREMVFQLLFEAAFNGEKTAEEILDTAMAERDVPDNAYIRETFVGCREAEEELDVMIGAYAKNWKVSRMSMVSKSILRLAAFELMKTSIPPRVAIDEAVELSKMYDDGDAPAFVNRVLNKLAHAKGMLSEDESIDEAAVSGN